MACEHEPKVARVCAHLATEYCEVYGGRGLAHDLVCPACAEAGTAATARVCAACAARAIAGLAWNAELGVVGAPALAQRDAELTFSHERVELVGRLPAPILDLQPAPGAAPVFYGFLADGGLYRIDLAARSHRRVADLAARRLHKARAVALVVAFSGEVAGVVNDEGGHGALVALDDGRETLALARGDFGHGDRFPLALVARGGRTLALHATRWNRLDLSDALTGELLTARSYGDVAEGQRPAHYLDFRHGRLVTSPDGARVADAGAREDGLAYVASFALEAMLAANPWESEDGTSRREHLPRWYAAQPPMVWLDERQLAVWGYGPSEACLIDAVCVCDAASGALLRWFPGVPRGELVAAGPYLVALTPDGAQVFDPDSGVRLLDDRSLVPQRYHPGAGAFVSTNPGGDFFVLSRLVGGGA